jgi:hypothetical protein
VDQKATWTVRITLQDHKACHCNVPGAAFKFLGQNPAPFSKPQLRLRIGSA